MFDRGIASTSSSTRLTVLVPTTGTCRIAFCVKSRTKWHFALIAVVLAASAYCHAMIYYWHGLNHGLPADIYPDDRPDADAFVTTSLRRSSPSSRIVHMTREVTSTQRRRSNTVVKSSRHHVDESESSSEMMVDETQLLPMLDSTDVAHAAVFRRQSFPYPDEECVPYHAWQTESFTTCNVLHELDLNSAFMDLTWHKRGGRHYTWRVGRGDDDLAMRTVRFDKNFTESDRESTRIDHLAMERTTSSNYTLDLYGYCGGTTLTEFATGKEMCRLLEVGRDITDRRKLDYAIDIARGYVDLQSIGCDDAATAARMESSDGTYAVAAECNATIVHQDASCSNYLLGDDGRFKLHDFNVGRLLYWNPENGRPCGYRNIGLCGEKGLPRVNSKSPEECRNEGMTEKVDTFAFGSALFELLTGRPPYQAVHGEEDLDTEEIRRRILEHIEPGLPMAIASENATDSSTRAIWLAMKKARGFNAQDRPTMREIANFLILERAQIVTNEVG